MRRRNVVAALTAFALSVSFKAHAQAQARVPHIGYLSTGTQEANGALLDALKDSLLELGYVDGKNIVIDAKWVGADANRFPEVAASMARVNPRAIIGTCVPSTRAAKNATATIPVVMSIDGDPVAAGLVASLAHSGGNVTGTSTLFEALIPKWIELLNEAVPKARNVAVLSDPDNVVDEYLWAKTKDAAERLGLAVRQFGARQPTELEPAFADMKRTGFAAAVVLTEAFLTSQQESIVALVDRHRMPAIFGYSEFARAGGLMSYGVSYRAFYRRVARYLDAVLKGAKPADLAVEQPTKIELVVNLKTAKALDLALPQSLLLRADEVIQ